tara:strand:+ start:24 stop:350 length:327 start_codon:yes stop_codon:yes gene_type:complete
MKKRSIKVRKNFRDCTTPQQARQWCNKKNALEIKRLSNWGDSLILALRQEREKISNQSGLVLRNETLQFKLEELRLFIKRKIKNHGLPDYMINTGGASSQEAECESLH